jgi:hypothetical protein
MSDYSWIKPATENIANLFGLNPRAAAEGRRMQSEQEFLAARKANTEADTGLSPYRQRLLEAQAGTQGALGGKYNAETGKTNAEAEGLKLTNNVRSKLADAVREYVNAAPEVRRAAGANMAGLLAQVGVNPEQSIGAVRDAESLINSTTNPELAAQQGKISAAFGPDAAFSAAERQKAMANKAAASQAEALAVQQEKNKGSIAESLARGGQPTQPDQIELNRQADAVKAGAEWAMKVPFNGGFLDEGQAYQLSQAARAANPTLNPQDAIVKFVRDNPKMLQGNWEMFGKNKVDIPGGVPATVPAAPVAAAQAAPAAAAPAAKPLTRQDVAAMPDGSVIVIQGQNYRKQGGQLVKVK